MEKEYHMNNMNSVKMTLLSVSSRSSVDRAPARCSGGHGFDSCRGLRYFFVPRSCHVEYFIFHKRILVSFKTQRVIQSGQDIAIPRPLW